MSPQTTALLKRMARRGFGPSLVGQLARPWAFQQDAARLDTTNGMHDLPTTSTDRDCLCAFELYKITGFDIPHHGPKLEFAKGRV